MSEAMTAVRPPAVAGYFYERDARRLTEQVTRCLSASPSEPKLPFIGAVVPHAGLMYSGAVAGFAYNRMQLPKRFIILCPNHTGAGAAAAINGGGSWRTPLGEVRVDSDLAQALSRTCDLLREDDAAHAREHSLEVQLPFLQHLIGNEFRFVPICLSLPTVNHCRRLGEAIAEVVRESGEEVGIIASSDLNHYEEQETTLRKDQRAIDAVLALDPEELWTRIGREDISMCGYIPTTTMLFAAKALGATRAELLRHATSGDVNHDYGAVVGYAAMVVG